MAGCINHRRREHQHQRMLRLPRRQLKPPPRHRIETRAVDHDHSDHAEPKRLFAAPDSAAHACINLGSSSGFAMRLRIAHKHRSREQRIVGNKLVRLRRRRTRDIDERLRVRMHSITDPCDALLDQPTRMGVAHAHAPKDVQHATKRHDPALVAVATGLLRRTSTDTADFMKRAASKASAQRSIAPCGIDPNLVLVVLHLALQACAPWRNWSNVRKPRETDTILARRVRMLCIQLHRVRATRNPLCP